MTPRLTTFVGLLLLTPLVVALGTPMAPVGAPCTEALAIDGCAEWHLRIAPPPNTTFFAGTSVRGEDALFTQRFVRAPGNLLVLGPTQFSALDPATGAPTWNLAVSDRWPGVIAPVGRDMLHFTHLPGEGLTVLETRSGATGEILVSVPIPHELPLYPWVLEPGHGLVYGAAWLDRPRPYPGALPIADVFLFAYDPETQQLAWARTMDTAQFELVSSLTPVEDGLIVAITAYWGQTSVVVKFDPAGGEIWRSDQPSPDGRHFSIGRSVHFSRSEGGSAIAFASSTGEFYDAAECVVEVVRVVRKFCTVERSAWIWTLDAGTGDRHWIREWHPIHPQLNADENPFVTPPASALTIAATPDGDALIVGGNAGVDPRGASEALLMRLRADTGEVDWMRRGNGILISHPRVEGERVLTFGSGLRIQAHHLATGIPLGHHDQPCDPIEHCGLVHLRPIDAGAIATMTVANGKTYGDEKSWGPAHDLVITKIKLG